MKLGKPFPSLAALLAARMNGWLGGSIASGQFDRRLVKGQEEALTPGAKPRYDTVLKLLHGLGVKLTAGPLAR